MHLVLNFPNSSPQDVLYASSDHAAIDLLATGIVTEITISEAWCQKHDPGDSIVRFLDQQVRGAKIPMPEWTISGSYEDARSLLFALEEHCRQRGMRAPLTQEAKHHVTKCGLNLAETFEQFVCGSGNEAAYGFAVLASQSADAERNPLLIIGPANSGKSHLLNAIGLQCLSYASQAKVQCIAASAFLYPDRLDQKLVTLDMLLIDNLQAVIGHRVAQDRIRITGETLAIRGRQVVLSLCAETNELPELEESLLNYIKAGVAVFCARQIELPVL